MLIIYSTGLIVSLIAQRNLFLEHESAENGREAKWPLRYAIGILLLAGSFITIESELLVAKVEHAVTELKLPEIFIGIILVPILGNGAEYTAAVLMAIRNKVDISVEIAVGSSMQIAMFVAPMLILFSFALGRPLIYVYDPFEVVAVISAIFLSLYVFQDGKTYWLEGALLIFAYLLYGVAFFFI